MFDIAMFDKKDLFEFLSVFVLLIRIVVVGVLYIFCLWVLAGQSFC